MIYWNFNSIPELDGLSKDERHQLIRSSYFKAFVTRFAPWTGLITIIALIQVGGSIDETYGGVFGAVIGGFLFGQTMIESMRSCIKEMRDKT